MTDLLTLMRPTDGAAGIARNLMEAAATFESAQAFLDRHGDDVVSLACTIARDRIKARNVISSWSALLTYLRVQNVGAGREAFRVLFLDKRNQLIADEVMGEGTVDHAPVYPREVVRRALELDASSIILTHNHPSGDVTPSGADVDMTRQVVEACKALRITVHDHVITGHGEVASFKALGLM